MKFKEGDIVALYYNEKIQYVIVNCIEHGRYMIKEVGGDEVFDSKDLYVNNEHSWNKKESVAGKAPIHQPTLSLFNKIK